MCLDAFKAISQADPSVLTWGSFFVKNMIPVTLGNIVGGMGFVGIAYWFTYLRTDKKDAVLSGKK